MSLKHRSKNASRPLSTKSPGPPTRPRVLKVGLVAFLLAGCATAAWWATRFDPFGSAWDDYDHRNYRSALIAAEDYLKQWPHDSRASLMAARSANRLGQLPRAEHHYQHAGLLDIADLHDRAYGLVLMSRPEQAVKLYQEILERSPSDALALKRMAAVLMDYKRYKELPAIAERLISIPGEEVAGKTLSGIANHVSLHYPEAENDFLKVLELDPELKSMPLPEAVFWNHLAVDMLAQGKASEARTYLNRGIEQTHDAGLTELLGLAYHQEGRDDEAERCWRLAIERDPNQSHAWLDLGQLAIVRRRPKEAVELLKRAAELEPEMVEPYQNLSLAYKMLDEREKAELARKTAAELRALHPEHTPASRDRDRAIVGIPPGRQP